MGYIIFCETQANEIIVTDVCKSHMYGTRLGLGGGRLDFKN